MLDKRAFTGFTCGLLFCLLFGYTVVKTKREKGIDYFPKLEARHQHYILKLPEEITFAGERVHFKTPSSYKRFDRELKHNTRKNSSTRLLLRNVRVWLPEIEYIIRRHQLPDDFKFLALAESNLSNVVSHKQAVGFWQLTENTALELGLVINDEVDERYHPLMATEAACKYFKRSYKVFGNWTSAAASYNRGISGILRAYEDQQVENFYDLELNDETSRYMYKILAMKDLINNPDRYKMILRRSKSPYIKKIKVDTSITNLVKFCKKVNVPYLTLKEYNPWLLKNTLTVPEGKSYVLLIPFNEIGIAEPVRKVKKDTTSKKIEDKIVQKDFVPEDTSSLSIMIQDKIIF